MAPSQVTLLFFFKSQHCTEQSQLSSWIFNILWAVSKYINKFTDSSRELPLKPCSSPLVLSCSSGSCELLLWHSPSSMKSSLASISKVCWGPDNPVVWKGPVSETTVTENATIYKTSFWVVLAHTKNCSTYAVSTNGVGLVTCWTLILIFIIL